MLFSLFDGLQKLRWSHQKFPPGQNFLELAKASIAGSSKKLQEAITTFRTFKLDKKTEVFEIVLRYQIRLCTVHSNFGASATDDFNKLVLNRKDNLKEKKNCCQLYVIRTFDLELKSKGKV